MGSVGFQELGIPWGESHYRTREDVQLTILEPWAWGCPLQGLHAGKISKSNSRSNRESDGSGGWLRKRVDHRAYTYT